MKPLNHTTAKASYYNTRAHCYDEFNEDNSKATNAILKKILKEHNVSTVLDLTCGTGSQVFWLSDSGRVSLGLTFESFDLASESSLMDGMTQKVYLRKKT